jgi:pyruvate formate lyase activating enzyme
MKDGTSMNGIITDIQKFSLTDGAGIRTTVFLKGCNMRCRWCHNPETLRVEPQTALYPDKCIHCGHCDRCPTGARVTLGREVSAQAVLAELAADLPYYRASGGGVTLSGGEPLMQPAFCVQLLRLCREAGIRAEMETNLSLPFERLAPLLGLLDKVYFDIKLMDDARHRELTGVSNAAVLDNARALAQTGTPAGVRTPLIPGLTATAENIAAIAAFAGSLGNVHGYELLNYNPLGEPKYTALGMAYPLYGLARLTRAQLEALAAVAGGHGVPISYR